MSKIKSYFSLIKFSHTLFALPFAFIGAILGYRQVLFEQNPWELFLSVVLCMFFARSAAMTFNRYADSEIDALNSRTSNREIPKGIFSRRKVLIFAIINSLLFVISTYFINKLVFLLSPVALLIILGYSYAKRFTFLSHFWLGLSLGLAPLGAYLVFVPIFSWQPLYFSLVVIFWVSGFDIIYAILDADFDKQYGLFSIPSKFGIQKALNISFLLHLLAMITTFIIGYVFEMNFLYWIGSVLFSILLIIQHILLYIDMSQRSINVAFATINSYAGLVYGLFVIFDLLNI